jgi:urease accessory protein
MLTFTHQLTERAEPQATMTLPFDQRRKTRVRVQLDNGTEAVLLLPRGTVLRHGDLLGAEDGMIVAVHAAPESVSTAFAKDALILARACYHLGNRHVALQITESWVRYQHDHVLDAMVTGLGLDVVVEQAPFEPEAGAYGQEHSHHHDH